MKYKLLSAVIASAFTVGVGVANAANHWDSVVNEDYLNENLGSTVNALTDLENGSRWYTLNRVTSTVDLEDGDITDTTVLNFRLNGNTALTDDLSVLGNFWIKATEKNIIEDGFDDFTDSIEWEEWRIGIESKALGALTYGQHLTTWGSFALDLGMQGLLDSQADAGMKNSGKITYRNHFDNDLFVEASYDVESGISGVDIGIQNWDIYSFAPDSYGIYLSAHNGQPVITHGSKFVMGNVDFAGDPSNSDTELARADESLMTYSLNGYKNFGLSGRLIAGMAYSSMADGVTAESLKEQIKQQGMAVTEGGLGLSASLGYQVFPENFNGLSPIVYVTYDELGYSVTPELSWWFGSPGLRLDLAYSYHEDTEDIVRARFWWDF